MTCVAGTACIHDWPAQRVTVHYGNSLAEAALEKPAAPVAVRHKAQVYMQAQRRVQVWNWCRFSCSGSTPRVLPPDDGCHQLVKGSAGVVEGSAGARAVAAHYRLRSRGTSHTSHLHATRPGTKITLRAKCPSIPGDTRRQAPVPAPGAARRVGSRRDPTQNPENIAQPAQIFRAHEAPRNLGEPIGNKIVTRTGEPSHMVRAAHPPPTGRWIRPLGASTM